MEMCIKCINVLNAANFMLAIAYLMLYRILF